ncbi:zinc finger protein 345 [Danio aesculapii]|uniref:zinc finger protein 345 n=1 Tax=Danio aesculapii TaxID=1142201 RepID=UPI0024C0BC9A|nr:zinc finger protein 345 [Danio aesculapii]
MTAVIHELLSSVMGVLVESVVSELSKHLSDFTTVLSEEWKRNKGTAANKNRLKQASQAKSKEFAAFMELLSKATVETMVKLIHDRISAQVLKVTAKSQLSQEDKLDEGQAATSEPENGVLLEPGQNKDYEMGLEHHENSGPAANNQYQQLSSAPTDILASALVLSESQPSTSTNGAAEGRREPFVCESCGVSFSDGALLNIHNALHKERPFNCLICGNTFKMMKCLMKHQRFHTAPNMSIEFEGPLHEEEFIVQLETCDSTSLETLEVTTQDILQNNLDTEDVSCAVLESSQYAAASLVQTLNISIENTDDGQSNATHDMNMIKQSNDGLFRCKTCGKCFELRWKFINHVRAHVKHYKCSHCDKRFTMRSCLIRHAATHTGAQLFKCDICSKSFVFQASLEKHKHLHTAEKTVTCPNCQKVFPGTRSFGRHRCRAVETLYNCPVCDKQFKIKQNMLDHQTLHTGEKPYCCEICGEFYSCERYLKNHQKSHIEKTYEFSCEICEKRFSARKHLQAHMLVHTREKRYTCDVCDKKFATSGNLNRHKAGHTGVKLYGCPICLKRYTTAYALKMHTHKHTSSKPFLCDVCGKGFTSSDYMKRHKRIIHAGRRDCVCSICNKAFIFPSSLNQHMLVHTGEKHHERLVSPLLKKFACDHCQKKFYSQAALTVHQRVHTKEKPYSCEICGKRFGYSSSIQMHMRIHTGERPFGCDVCGKTFNQAVHLRTHQRVHTGLKSFSCESCGKKFVDHRNLKQHKCKYTM